MTATKISPARAGRPRTADAVSRAQNRGSRYGARPRASVGLDCPEDPRHGPLIPWARSERWGWYCPHQEHAGRPGSHPLGAASQTRAFFTTDEAEVGLTSSSVPGRRPSTGGALGGLGLPLG